MTVLLDELRSLLGAANVLTGEDTAGYRRDWYGRYEGTPLAVVRPSSTEEASQVMAAAYAAGVSMVPISGNTGTSGGTHGQDALMISLQRMNRIAEVRPLARTAIVEAGATVGSIHEAVAAHDLIFPLHFGAQGTAMIGGALATNAGGSNVLRYGNARASCQGIEVVLPDGRVMNLMSELHKDNSGYDLRDLIIGAEGTLGLITRAVLRLQPKSRAHATAMVGMEDLGAAMDLLARLQVATGSAVEAFECMPKSYIDAYLRFAEGATPPFADSHAYTVLIEIGVTAPKYAEATASGEVPIVALLEELLAEAMEAGGVRDAVVAQSEAQRAALWKRRELAAELSVARRPCIDNDIALPTHAIADFLWAVEHRFKALDAGAEDFWVSHLGDGNIHYTVYPTSDDAGLKDGIVSAIEDEVMARGGSFSAEHGIGLSKVPSMKRRKDPVALDVMHAIKAALDPKGLMNPGKVLPPA
ncbi:MAG: FAD-binding oxidoreductase [Pseudomonadota bacterium]